MNREGQQVKSTVSFGQAMPEVEMDRAREAAMEADLMITLGSTGLVTQAMSGLVVIYSRALREGDYVEVNAPQVMDKALWETSGHWQTYRENMFVTQTEDERVFALKPMNCPGHVQIFKNGLKSYRDLPVKIAEFGVVHRYEPSGALHGMMRVRAFTQDDAHIFCTEDQVRAETKKFIDLLRRVAEAPSKAERAAPLLARSSRAGADTA